MSGARYYLMHARNPERELLMWYWELGNPNKIITQLELTGYNDGMGIHGSVNYFGEADKTWTVMGARANWPSFGGHQPYGVTVVDKIPRFTEVESQATWTIGIQKQAQGYEGGHAYEGETSIVHLTLNQSSINIGYPTNTLNLAGSLVARVVPPNGDPYNVSFELSASQSYDNPDT